MTLIVMRIALFNSSPPSTAALTSRPLLLQFLSCPLALFELCALLEDIHEPIEQERMLVVETASNRQHTPIHRLT